MPTLRERLANLFDREDVSYQELKAFFREELLELAVEVDALDGVAADLIRSKADELN